MNNHNAPSARTIEENTPQFNDEQREELIPLDSQLIEEEDEGYESDDERPSKRNRMDSAYY